MRGSEAGNAVGFNDESERPTAPSSRISTLFFLLLMKTHIKLVVRSSIEENWMLEFEERSLTTEARVLLCLSVRIQTSTERVGEGEGET